MWERHWGLSVDPFLGPGSPFVRTSGHGEALARLVDTVETGQRLAVLRGGAGLGKSAVLARAVAETRGPRRRVARVAAPADGAGLFAGLAEGLGVRAPADPGRAAAWKALSDAARLCRWQKLHAVLVVDDAQSLADPPDLRDLERLTHLDPHPAARLTVLLSYRDEPPDGPTGWLLTVRLDPLTRSETARYVVEKLAAAGRTDPAFTPRALARLHDRSGGVPRGIDRLGSLALMAAALRGLEVVTPDVVDGATLDVGQPCGLF